MNEEITCNFVGSFKVGDNLVFNCSALCDLVSSNKNGALNKFVVLQVGSILEASLAEIIYRAQNFNREGVPKISEQDQAEIKEKKIDKFNSIIDVLKKYKVLDDLGPDIYDELHKLRKYRNKVHIQDDIDLPGVSRDEAEAFSDEIRDWALDLNTRILKHLSEKLNRPKHLEGFVAPLTIPASKTKPRAEAANVGKSNPT